MKKKKTKTDYSIEYRSLSKDGIWSNWSNRGEGIWIDLKTFQSQIKMLRKAVNRTMEIKAIYKGNLINYMGEKTGQPIKYEKAR